MLMRFISLEKTSYGFLKFQFLGHRRTMLNVVEFIFKQIIDLNIIFVV
jgi:hypothetical protein